MTTKKTYNNDTLTVLGTIWFPKYEANGCKMAIELTEESEQSLKDYCEENFPAFKPIVPKEIEEGELQGTRVINTKSNFNFPVLEYVTKKPLMEEDGTFIKIYHGARAYVNISVKEYTFKKQKGITNYLRGIVLISQGEKPKGTDYDSLMAGCNEEMPW